MLYCSNDIRLNCMLLILNFSIMRLAIKLSIEYFVYFYNDVMCVIFVIGAKGAHNWT
jgi:hypothetical protein